MHDHKTTSTPGDAKRGPGVVGPVPATATVPFAPGGQLTPDAVLALQRSIGNRAVAGLIQRDHHEHGAGCGHGQEAPAVQRSAVHDVLAGSGRPLDAPLRAEMEGRLGADFSDVRLHTGPAAQRSAAGIGARAYTSGNHVVIGEGGGDKHTLAHELTHVIQQRQGPVAGADNGQGLSVSDPSDRFEREAEAVATEVMRAPARDTAAPRVAAAPDGAATATAPVQRAKDGKARKAEKQQWQPGGASKEGSPSSLNQTQVQERMGYVCELLYGSRVSGDAAVRMKEWLDALKLNGLCGGWVRIHENNPTWLEPMWAALVAWEPTGNRGKPHEADLRTLGELLRRGGVGAVVGEEAKEVVIAISTAWNVMRGLEPDAGYQDVTDLLGDSTVAPKSYPGWKDGSFTKITCKPGEAGRKLTEYITAKAKFSQDKVKEQYYARIETPTHHMGVRVSRDGKDSRTVMVCETEVTGIVRCTSWEEMQSALQAGCNGHEDDSIELEVTVSNA